MRHHHLVLAGVEVALDCRQLQPCHALVLGRQAQLVSHVRHAVAPHQASMDRGQDLQQSLPPCNFHFYQYLQCDLQVPIPCHTSACIQCESCKGICSSRSLPAISFSLNYLYCELRMPIPLHAYSVKVAKGSAAVAPSLQFPLPSITYIVNFGCPFLFMHIV